MRAFVANRPHWSTFDLVESQMNERERLEILVRLAVESRNESSIRSQLTKVHAQDKVRSLPALEGVLCRAKARQSNTSDRLNYTYGL